MMDYLRETPQRFAENWERMMALAGEWIRIALEVARAALSALGVG